MSLAFAADVNIGQHGYESLDVAIFGRCLLPNTLEVPCQACNISPDSVGVIAGHTPRIDDKIIIYLDHIGRLEGIVAKLFSGGFYLEIHGTSRYKEKIAERIEWLKENNTFSADDGRRHERIEPRDKNSEIKLPDGRAYGVEIIDISLSGAAVKVDVKPALGTHLTLAGMQGEVVRHIGDGIAIQFAKRVPIKQLERAR